MDFKENKDKYGQPLPFVKSKKELRKLIQVKVKLQKLRGTCNHYFNYNMECVRCGKTKMDLDKELTEKLEAVQE